MTDCFAGAVILGPVGALETVYAMQFAMSALH
jgi:hypothetical protein